MTNFYQWRLWFRYRGLFLFILFSFLPYFVSLVFSFAVPHCFSFPRLLAVSVTYICCFLLFVLLQSVRISRFRFFKKKDITVVFVSLFVGAAAYIAAFGVTFSAVSILSAVFGSDLPAWITASNKGFISFLNGDNASVKMLWFVIITVAAPVNEEIIFRGYLQDCIAQLCHHRMPILTSVVCSIIFALFHTNSLANMIFAFIVGIFLSLTVQRHGSLVYSVITHGTVNAVSLLCGLLIK